MALWLAVDEKLEALDVNECDTEEQAFYQFMKLSIYPHKVIKLPSSVMLAKDCVHAHYYYD